MTAVTSLGARDGDGDSRILAEAGMKQDSLCDL